MDPSIVTSLVTVAVSIFAIMDPPAAIPTLISYIGVLGGDFGKGDMGRLVARTVNKASIAMLLLLTLFSLFGEYVLKLFNISLEALRIAGGVLLMIIAAEMLLSKERPEEVKSGDFAVVPIATPLIVGPGTMSTLIVYSRIYGPLVTLAGAYIAFAMAYPLLRYSYLVLKYLGPSVLQGLAKFMSIIVASIAVELLISGLRGLSLI
ncbi:MAG: MarC family protein [Desulfurococcaceae archaeon]|nr:MarC family protein [Desulfurococcaceae archaeon]